MRILVYGCAGHLLGGIETFLLNMNAHMSDHCVFDYIILGNDCIHRQAIRKKGGRVLTVPPPRARPVSYFRCLWKMLRDNRREYRVVYINLFSMLYFLPVWMCRSQGYRVILHAHNNGLQHNGRIYKLLHNIGKILLKTGDYVRWTNSKASSDFMFGKGVDSELIYNAIDVERFSFKADVRDKVRNQNNVTHELVIGFVGRLANQKNPLFLIKVFKEVLILWPTAVLWVIGEGEFEVPMRVLAKQLDVADRIRWFGYRNDIDRLMMAIDVLVLTSAFEGLGNVLIEAQASGLPCVTSAGVVPNMVKITDRLRFEELESGPKAWARAVVNGVPCVDREKSYTCVAGSPFNIRTEAKRMEKMFQAVSAISMGATRIGFHFDR